MKNKKLLGLYIPTFNRASKLEQCLISAISEFSQYGLPIYVSDNGSTDDTFAILKRLRNAYPNLYFKKNGTNLGYARNVIEVLKMGNTEFVWLFGDDDLIIKGAVDMIVGALNQGYDFVQINTAVYNDDFSNQIGHNKISNDNDMVYQKGMHDSVLRNAKNGYAGYMAELITRKKYVDMQLKLFLKQTKAQDVSKKDFIHIPLFFNSIVGKKGILLSKPLIKYRVSTQASGRDMEIWLVSFPEAIISLKDYSYELRMEMSYPPNIIATAFVANYDHPERSKLNKNLVLSSKLISKFDKLAALMVLSIPHSITSMMKSAVTNIYYKIQR